MSNHVTPRPMRPKASLCAAGALFALFFSFAWQRNQPRTVHGVRIFSKTELAAYNGLQRRQIYMAIMGQVFDVTSGSKFYNQHNGGYDFFAATDGSLAFVTGDFKNNVTDDVSSLNPTELYNLATWVNDTYHTKYVYKGLLEGYFYDARGHKTAAMLTIQDLIELELVNKDKRKADEVLHPKCNSRRAKGLNIVWCNDNMVPRRRSVYGGQERCACIKDAHTAALDGANGAYPDCPLTNSTCSRTS